MLINRWSLDCPTAVDVRKPQDKLYIKWKKKWKGHLPAAPMEKSYYVVHAHNHSKFGSWKCTRPVAKGNDVSRYFPPFHLCFFHIGNSRGVSFSRFFGTKAFIDHQALFPCIQILLFCWPHNPHLNGGQSATRYTWKFLYQFGVMRVTVARSEGKTQPRAFPYASICHRTPGMHTKGLSIHNGVQIYTLDLRLLTHRWMSQFSPELFQNVSGVFCHTFSP